MKPDKHRFSVFKFFNAGQRNYGITCVFQFPAAGAKCFFNGHADARDPGTG